jgi:pimeloyl-ACP methyl ester carboxylesterase
VEQDTDELSPAERRVIELSRAARTPGEADKRRVRAALALSLGAVAGSATGAAVAASTSATAAKGAATLVGTRVIAAVLLAASAGTGAFVWLKNRPAPAPVVETALAPAAAPAPVVEPIAAPAEDPLLAEVSLLQRAQRALRAGQPKEAMELASRHATLYPTSQMALERDALRVFSLCALGRKAEARTLARALLAQAPTSPLRASLEESCALR